MNNVYNKGNNDNSQSGNIQLLKISCFILAFNTVSGKWHIYDAISIYTHTHSLSTPSLS